MKLTDRDFAEICRHFPLEHFKFKELEYLANKCNDIEEILYALNTTNVLFWKTKLFGKNRKQVSIGKHWDGENYYWTFIKDDNGILILSDEEWDEVKDERFESKKDIMDYVFEIL